MPCTGKPFTSRKLFQASVCHAQASLSQDQNYFEQVCDMHKQPFHKAKIISSKCMPCTGKPLTRRKLFQASVCNAQASLSQNQNYFKQVCDMHKQTFQKDKIISSKCMPCTGKPFTRPKIFQPNEYHEQASISQGQNYFEQVCDMHK